MGINYKARRAKGQCVNCKNKAVEGRCRCQRCWERERERVLASRANFNARRRERAFARSMEREKRMELLEVQLEQEVAVLWERYLASLVNQGTDEIKQAS